MNKHKFFQAYEAGIKQTYSFVYAQHALQGAAQIAKAAYQASAFDVSHDPLATKKATPANDFFDLKVFSAYTLLTNDIKAAGNASTIDTMNTKYTGFSREVDEFNTNIKDFFDDLKINNENYHAFVNNVCTETNPIKKVAFQDYCQQHNSAMPLTDANLAGSDTYSVMCTQSFIDTACGWYNDYATIA